METFEAIENLLPEELTPANLIPLEQAFEQQQRQEAGSTIIIDDTPLKFSLSESLETVREPRDDHDLDGPHEFGHSRFDEKRVPSDQLTLEILAGDPYHTPGCQRTWRETRTKRLEDRLNSFVAGLVQMVARVKENGAEQQRRAKERRQAERRKLYQTKKAHFNELLTQAENHQKNQRVRQSIEAVRAEHASEGPIAADSELAKWIEWAKLRPIASIRCGRAHRPSSTRRTWRNSLGITATGGRLERALVGYPADGGVRRPRPLDRIVQDRAAV